MRARFLNRGRGKPMLYPDDDQEGSTMSEEHPNPQEGATQEPPAADPPAEQSTEQPVGAFSRAEEEGEAPRVIEDPNPEPVPQVEDGDERERNEDGSIIYPDPTA